MLVPVDPLLLSRWPGVAFEAHLAALAAAWSGDGMAAFVRCAKGSPRCRPRRSRRHLRSTPWGI
eukprot:4184259-Pleurochrysis_carterae.AAC.6